jgi:hypothetical protein
MGWDHGLDEVVRISSLPVNLERPNRIQISSLAFASAVSTLRSTPRALCLFYFSAH